MKNINIGIPETHRSFFKIMPELSRHVINGVVLVLDINIPKVGSSFLLDRHDTFDPV